MGLDMYAFTTSKDVMDKDFQKQMIIGNLKSLIEIFSIGENSMNQTTG